MPAVAKMNHHFMRHLFELMWHYLIRGVSYKMYIIFQVRIHYSLAVSSPMFVSDFQRNLFFHSFNILVPTSSMPGTELRCWDTHSQCW